MTPHGRRFLLLLFLTGSAWPARSVAAEPDAAPINGEQLALLTAERYDSQSRDLCAYHVTRIYTLSNKHLNGAARMEVEVTYKKGEKKHFKVLSLSASGIARRSLLDLLQQETASEGYQSDKSTLSPRNYRFRILGQQSCGAVECYQVRMVPKQRSEYLVDATALISTRDYRYVEVTGSMSKSPSLWLSRPEVDQRFIDVDGFRLPSYNHSKTHILFLGDADLTIQYGTYTVERCRS